MADMDQVLVVGGGIGGLTAAIALQQAAIPVRVFEQASALREVGAGVSLWPNAMRALALLGLAEPVLGEHTPMERIVLKRRDGTVLMRLHDPGRYDEPGICIHRSELQQRLAAEVPADRFRLGRRLVDFHVDQGGVTGRFQDGSTVRGALLIGCDGIRSIVRARLHGDTPTRPRGYEIWRGVSDFDLPDDLRGQSTEWWAPGHRFGLLPGEPGRVFWYGTHTTTGADSGDGNGASGSTEDHAPDIARVRTLFADWPFPVPELLEAAGDGDIVRTVAEDRPVPRTWGRGPVTLLGDAAHPMTPNMGQGACTAIEDAVVLAGCLASGGLDAAALRGYEDARARRTRRIVRQSRRIGRLGQLTSPGLVAVRDGLMRWFPERLVDLAQSCVYGYRLSSPTGRRAA